MVTENLVLRFSLIYLRDYNSEKYSTYLFFLKFSFISFLQNNVLFYVLEDKEVMNYLKNISYTGTYQDFAPMLTGENFDADKWAELFAQAGAQFVSFFILYEIDKELIIKI